MQRITNKQAFQTWHGTVFAAVLAALFLVTAMTGLCGQEPEQAEIKKHSINIGKLDRQIRRHLDKIEESRAREARLLDELDRLDKRLLESRDKLARLTEQLHSQEMNLAAKSAALAKVEQVRDQARSHLRKRLRSFYVTGKVGLLNVLFSKKNLPDLMIFSDAYRQLLEYDRKTITSYHETILRLTKAREAEKLEKKILEDLVEQAAAEENDLAEIYRQKQQILTTIKTRKGLYEQAVQRMKKDEQELTRSLARLKKVREKRTRGFLLNKGRLPGPVIGEIVTRFGEKTDNGPCHGIIIHTEENAPVYSVYSGTVIFTGYKMGFGNMVIIDHGLDYYTVTAYLDTITVHEGQRVLSKEEIGTTGDMATLYSQGLYFEIRHGKKPLDPLKWLYPNSYPTFIPLPLPGLDQADKLTWPTRPKNAN